VSLVEKSDGDLGARQHEILLCVLAGESEFSIADRLSLSLDVVKRQVAAMHRVAVNGGWPEMVERVSRPPITHPFEIPNEIPPAVTVDVVKRPRILLVEDHPINRVTIEFLLGPLEVELDMAVNGAEGVRMFAAGRYDLVLMDVDMPVMDGLSATRSIRALERTLGVTPTPIAILTAHSAAERRMASLEAGADAHLCKPVDPEQLFSLVDGVRRPRA